MKRSGFQRHAASGSGTPGKRTRRQKTGSQPSAVAGVAPHSDVAGRFGARRGSAGGESGNVGIHSVTGMRILVGRHYRAPA